MCGSIPSNTIARPGTTACSQGTCACAMCWHRFQHWNQDWRYGTFRGLFGRLGTSHASEHGGGFKTSGRNRKRRCGSVAAHDWYRSERVCVIQLCPPRERRCLFAQASNQAGHDRTKEFRSPKMALRANRMRYIGLVARHGTNSLGRRVARATVATDMRTRTIASLPAPPETVPVRRVVVTGIGMVTPLGIGTDPSWSGLVAGKCGVRVRTLAGIALCLCCASESPLTCDFPPVAGAG